MKKIILAALVLGSSLSLKSQVNGVILADTNNIQVVKVWGTHYERGFAYSSLMGPEITQTFSSYLKPQFGSQYSVARNMVTNGQHLKIDSVFKVEARAIIAGMDAAGTNTTRMDYVDLLVANSFLDISEIMGVSPGMGCSSLMSWGDATAGTDLDGKSVISRHLDWSTSSYLVNNQIILINLPSETDEQPWLCIGFAGLFSVLSGFNQNLGVFQNMMDDFTGSSIQGNVYEPIWFTLRKSIEKSDYNSDGQNNVGDVRSALMDQTAGCADGYLISTLARSTENLDILVAMVAEVAPVPPYLTFRSNSYDDKIPGDNLYAANSQIARNNAKNYCSKYNAVVTQLASGTGVSSTESWELLRDYSQLSHNLQFMQYAPELDLFKISPRKGTTAGYLRDPVAFSISELFSAYNGIDDPVVAEPAISLYPNPVDGMLTLEGLSRQGGDVIITVNDVSGKQVFYKKINNPASTFELNMEALAGGVYVVLVKCGAKTTSYKMVKSDK
ncbi:MAG: T9SS type A sorting domain-containing protein [Bacteroidota bacterium]